MALYAAAARRRRGEVRGGEAGAALVRPASSADFGWQHRPPDATRRKAMPEQFHRFAGEGEPAPETAFAPAERATRARVEAEVAALTSHPLLQSLLDAADVSVLVLNRARQILVGNAALLAAVRVDGMDLLEGLRPGEAYGCIHADSPGGCGTRPECAACGAVLAILESQRTGAPVERECLMTVRRGQSLDALELRVRASQARIAGELFTVVGLRDISAEKRRATLERVFLHDIANTATPLVTFAQVLALQAPAEVRDTAERIAGLAARLQREIEDQRVLLQAESGTLATERGPVEPESALKAAVAIVHGHPVARGRVIEVRDGRPPHSIQSDESLLIRVLVNMLKNALEATPEGGTVKAWVEDAPGGCELRVWNPGAMPSTVALQVFKRSFSTKGGTGRGLGTFSMKLFGERYLGGTVGFTSTQADGTTFFVRLPA
jgi:signal transduction histidine kinase